MWDQVQIIAEAGTQFAIIEDYKGCLVIITRRRNEDWPYGIQPIGGFNQIGTECTRYVVTEDDNE